MNKPEGVTVFRISLFRWTIVRGELAFDLEAFRELVLLLFRNLGKTIAMNADDINKKLDDALAAVTTANGKTDTLLQGNADLKTQVAALQAQIAAGGTVSADDLQGFSDKIDAITAAVTSESTKEDTAIGGAGTGDGTTT